MSTIECMIIFITYVATTFKLSIVVDYYYLIIRGCAWLGEYLHMYSTNNAESSYVLRTMRQGYER